MDNVKQLLRGGWPLTIYITLKPLYLIPSGNLQLADLFMLLVLVASFPIIIRCDIWKIRDFRIALTILFCLCVFQFGVNTAWSLYLDITFIKSSLYYVFNFLVFAYVIMLGNEIGQRDLKSSLYRGTIASLVVVYIGFLWQVLFRMNVALSYSRYSDPLSAGAFVSFFNNPNQLGYHCLILMALTLYTRRVEKICNVDFTLCACMLAIVASSSRAAIVSGVVLIVLHELHMACVSRTNLVFTCVVVSMAVVCTTWLLLFAPIGGIESNSFVASLRGGFKSAIFGGELDFGSSRGYARVFEIGPHFLWGMGEGAYWRFKSLKGLEVHCTYISLFVSYGLIGLVGYGAVFARCIYSREHTMRAGLLPLTGVLIYQLAHNGIRNTLVWLLLASMLYCGTINKISACNRRQLTGTTYPGSNVSTNH